MLLCIPVQCQGENEIGSMFRWKGEGVGNPTEGQRDGRSVSSGTIPNRMPCCDDLTGGVSIIIQEFYGDRIH